MHFVSLVKKELGQIRTILSGDTGDQRFLRQRRSLYGQIVGRALGRFFGLWRIISDVDANSEVLDQGVNGALFSTDEELVNLLRMQGGLLIDEHLMPKFNLTNPPI